MNVLSLCSGIGGLDLALDLATGGAAKSICYVEGEAHAAAILAARMEEGCLAPAPIWNDLTTFDGRPWRGVVDCITAGYPCQPFSIAGRRAGTDDPRHLWPHVARVSRESEAALIFLENVPGHLSLGFDVVCQDLHSMGYKVAAGLFSAEEIGAPHLRKRLFILANRIGSRLAWPWLHLLQGTEGQSIPDSGGAGAELAQPVCGGLGRTTTVGQASQSGQGQEEASAQLDGSGNRDVWPPKPGDDWTGVAEQYWPVEPSVCRVANGTAGRVDRLRACGNGVVPLAGANAFITLMRDLNEAMD